MEITEGENTIRLSRAAMPPPHTASAPTPTTQAGPPDAGPSAASRPSDHPVAGKVPERIVKSPLVGTFYDSPSPDAQPYVAVGSAVSEGDTLCLIEAMKTFNQIDAESAGIITVIHKNNGDPVEYGEPLFVIESRD